MKAGDYVRTKLGEIFKLNNIIYQDDNYIQYQLGGRLEDKDFLKSSPNIIELLEVGDYVNGSKVVRIEEHNEELYVYVQESEEERETEWLKHCATYGHWQKVEYETGIDLHKAINKQVEELGWK